MPLAGKFQGGHGKGSSPAPKQEGYRGRGIMPFATKGPAKRDIIRVTERPPMPNARRGRVLYSSQNKRIGRQEGTGPQS